MSGEPETDRAYRKLVRTVFIADARHRNDQFGGTGNENLVRFKQARQTDVLFPKSIAQFAGLPEYDPAEFTAERVMGLKKRCESRSACSMR